MVGLPGVIWFSSLQVMKMHLASSSRAALLDMVVSNYIWQFKLIQFLIYAGHILRA